MPLRKHAGLELAMQAILRIREPAGREIFDCDQPGWRRLPMRLAPGGLPISRQTVQEIETIPCFPGLTANEIEWVASALADWQGVE